MCSSSSNSFLVLDGKSQDFDKENAPLKRFRKPTFKVAEALEKEVEAVSKKKKPGPKGAGNAPKHTKC